METVVQVRFKKQADLASNVDLLRAFAEDENGKVDEIDTGPSGLGINDEPVDKFTVWFPTLWGAAWFMAKVVGSLLKDIYSVRMIGDGPEYERQARAYAKQHKLEV